MKTLKNTLPIIVFLCCSLLIAQNTGRSETGDKEQEKKTIKEVDQINKASAEINEVSENTSEAVKSTVENTKETAKAIGSLFGSGNKEKKDKDTPDVVVIIHNVTYDDDNLNALYEKISKAKNVKKASKNFSGETATINLSSKENADALWQSVPKPVRSAFKMITMGESSITVQLAGTSFEEE
ncbi:hypothetical protein [Kriegella aquimaris]|uniref:Uncharacterized protein n=1 Tax=Kriegella aquimaris TaxID=192904 RepID=A0A1G9WDM7_9FLAO|nr:hypothetical protein [Kriegella aquimaris]SDM82580.1 hypothetical protein SAMN04488514_11565 [Kriegella aquimaris]